MTVYINYMDDYINESKNKTVLSLNYAAIS